MLFQWFQNPAPIVTCLLFIILLHQNTRILPFFQKVDIKTLAKKCSLHTFMEKMKNLIDRSISGRFFILSMSVCGEQFFV